MRIGINGFEAVVPRFGYDKKGLPNRVGSSEVCFELIQELSKIDKKNDYVIYLPIEPTPDMPKETEKWSYKIIPDRKLWTIFGLSPALRSNNNFDVFFSPTHYGPVFVSCPQVICLLDVSYRHFPQMFKKKDLLQLSLWGGYSIKNAAKIITISNSSKSDIIKEYAVPSDKVDVVYLGIKDGLKPKMGKEILNKYNVQKPYILFVGTLQPRKNIARLIEAFSFIPDNSELELVIIGRKGWNFEEILAAPQKFGVEERVSFLENVTDEELPEFYENAQVFALPSLYEGFGLPILEAMKYGCPVVASNTSSLPEAGGDAALYFNPLDTHDIAEKIEKVLKDKSLAAKMKKEGFEQIKKFSWEKAAGEVLKVLEEAGSKNV